MLTCANCSRSVVPTKGFSWFWFIVLLVVFMPLVLIQLIVYITKSAQRCPLCKKNVYTGR